MGLQLCGQEHTENSLGLLHRVLRAFIVDHGNLVAVYGDFGLGFQGLQHHCDSMTNSRRYRIPIIYTLLYWI